MFVSFIRLIYGSRCPSCGKSSGLPEQSVLCEGCSLLWQNECDEVTESENNKNEMNKENKILLTDTIHRLIYLTHYRTYRSTVSKKLILDLKKHNYRIIYKFLADNLAKKIKILYNGVPGDTIVINVPRSGKAVIKYGFDQAQLLAKNISGILKSEYVGALAYKPGRRFIQQKMLTPEERRINALDSYYIKTKKIKSIYGKRCILVDDIFTTGATLSACAKLLDENGAKYVDCAFIARTVK